jgi:uncharacterized protein YjiS (DUF1127 family)
MSMARSTSASGMVGRSRILDETPRRNESIGRAHRTDIPVAHVLALHSSFDGPRRQDHPDAQIHAVAMFPRGSQRAFRGPLDPGVTPMFVATRRAGCELARTEDRIPAYLGTSGADAVRYPNLFKSAGETILLWRRRVEERQQLAEMTGRDRRDIGITRADVMQEINKPFWR